MTLWRSRSDPRPRFPGGRGSSRLWGSHVGRYRAQLARDAHAEGARRAWVARWRVVAEGCQLAKLVYVAAGVTVSAPRIGGVRLDDDGRVTSATVELLPGQTLRQYRDVAAQLAAALGCARVRFEPMAGAPMWVRLHLLDADPLARSLSWERYLPAGLVAVRESGDWLALPWEQRTHAIAQGQTGSGKSHWLYGQLAALAGRRDVLVAGVDPSGLLFAPWAGHPGAEWRASGLADGLADALRVLRALVDEMDRRLALLPAGVDVLATDHRTPLLAVVLEEYAGLIRAAQLAGKPIEAQARALVARLLQEGRKVGVRCLLVSQRADTTIVDGIVRDQCALRVSFASSAEGLRMLHPAGSVDADEHADADPGVAVVTAPRIGTIRGRGVDLSYRRYCQLVADAA
jgi:hypothetical protein